MEKEKIKNLIDKGLTNQQIANDLGINKSKLRRMIKKYELNRITFKKEIIDENMKTICVDLYSEGFVCTEISTKLKIHRTTVSKILKEKKIVVQKKFYENIERECLICNKNVCKRRKICDTCYTNVRRLKIKRWMIDYKGGECVDCKNKDLDIGCYEFHHLEPEKKDFILSSTNAAKMSFDKIKTELNKCVLLCSNCHRTRHSCKSQKLLDYVSEGNFLQLFFQKLLPNTE